MSKRIFARSLLAAAVVAASFSVSVPSFATDQGGVKVGGDLVQATFVRSGHQPGPWRRRQGRHEHRRHPRQHRCRRHACSRPPWSTRPPTSPSARTLSPACKSAPSATTKPANKSLRRAPSVPALTHPPGSSRAGLFLPALDSDAHRSAVLKITRSSAIRTGRTRRRASAGHLAYRWKGHQTDKGSRQRVEPWPPRLKYFSTVRCQPSAMPWPSRTAWIIIG